MQAYDVKLESPVSNSYFCKRAADSLDIDVNKKSIHELHIKADIESPYNIGVIVGASGSVKTTLAKKIFGNDCFTFELDQTKPIIEQFDESYDYDQRAKMLSGVGLTSVPCWIRPVNTLSNGQKSRAEAALLMSLNKDLGILDEWTSVVDRTVAKVMSYCIQKHARTQNKKIILLSCHYDVIEWINPDWIIDCNKQEYNNRRHLWRDFKRTEQIQFDIRESNKSSWKYFSKYHYLSENFPGGYSHIYGLYHGDNQIGFIAYSNYVPYTLKQKMARRKMIMHAHRIVIHPDYCGFGLGIKLTNETAKLLKDKYIIYCKFSSAPMYNSMKSNSFWYLYSLDRQMSIKGGINRKTGFRLKCKTYTFKFRFPSLD